MSDTGLIELLVAEFYAAFDNRDGRVPSGDELLAVFAPEATVTRVAGDGVDTWAPEQFVAPRIAILTDGTLTDFHEWEVAGETKVFGSIASRWSAYEKSGTMDGAAFGGGGQKSIQLRRDGERWLISSLLWQDDA